MSPEGIINNYRDRLPLPGWFASSRSVRWLRSAAILFTACDIASDGQSSSFAEPQTGDCADGGKKQDRGGEVAAAVRR